MFDVSGGEDRARWLRFALKLGALWATVLGAVAYGVTGDLDALWWGLRLTGGLTVVTGLFGIARHYRGEGRASGAGTPGWTPSRAFTGAVRVLLGAAVVVATL